MAETAERAGRRPLKVARAAEVVTPVVAVIDREGLVIGVLTGRAAARAFLREGRL